MDFVSSVLGIKRNMAARFRGQPAKRVLVLEGGGMRGIFLTGVLQAFKDHEYAPFELIIGSSAGALTGTAFAADQIWLARDAFFSELLSGHFIRMRNILRPEKHILNLDWMVNHIVMGKYPLNLRRLRLWGAPVLITATRLSEDQVPETLYLSTKADDIPKSLKATAAIPFFYRGFVNYKGYPLLDGGLLDPVPFQKALDMGYREDEILVVLTRQKGYRKKHESFWVTALYENYYRDDKYRFLLYSLNERYHMYNRVMDELEYRYPGIDVLYPPQDFAVNRLTRNEEKILRGFEDGVVAARSYLRGS
ncbi:MAG: patatin family protein [Desulfosalsimonadaceae bacterium]